MLLLGVVVTLISTYGVGGSSGSSKLLIGVLLLLFASMQSVLLRVLDRRRLG